MMSPRKKEPNSLSISILGFFQERPYHGYELFKHMTQTVEFERIWHVKQSLFYGFLDKFHQDGFLQLRVVEGEQYPDRKEYQLTASGQKLLDDWMRTPVRHGRDMRQEFLAKLYFAFNNHESVAIDLILSQKNECFIWLDQLAKENSAKESVYQQLIQQYRQQQIEAMIIWLDYLLANANHIGVSISIKINELGD